MKTAIAEALDIYRQRMPRYGDPVIIIGMHRSGTSMLARLLEESGVYLGYARDEHNESLFFQVINENIFRHEDLTWDHPGKLHQLFSDRERVLSHAERVMHLLDENLMEYFWGPLRYRQVTADPGQCTIPWGWKDPRNSLTLPVWKQFFPGAKVIHIIRNGLDVATSLWRRETSRKEGEADPHYSARCQTLYGCLEIWQDYVHSGRDLCRRFEPSLEIFYEDLLQDPRKTMQEILDFIDSEELQLPVQELSSIQKDRRLAHLKNSSLEVFYTSARDNELLQQLYGKGATVKP